MTTRTITAEIPMVPRMTEDPAQLVPELADVSAALFKVVGNGSVPWPTISLVQLRAGQIVGSTYLTVLHTGFLRKAGESEERITSVASWQTSPYFTAPERAALALVEAVLQAPSEGERVSDELYAQAAEHYDAKALATLMFAIGQVNFFIAVALIAKPVPGRSFKDPWN
ncbi:carboxymuconolactone decarboxylase family protein [Streptomyces alfalfae]|uniref:Alkylhydroperoxidase n=1 Tax=Streptomyces alfalfae TaxID=1642299 RepID=A0ABN4VVS0_9ACTN|nr:carboxymuconolactone decarboxylase family protein [Streptomyces alfalfae]APY89995.1 alkylhydroperoxidase [Streptomyces alfalfae]AYA20453.1 carboxymuconolactone decarboxylase family protein [Streptomyces fradiae]RXX42818.1 carboxymuconolactone decarboxylase family protein [Streptomyces alfalfae]RZM86355.1 carboxymuconolactone decarboxylase family protein [Streptomyces alfalfae]